MLGVPQGIFKQASNCLSQVPAWQYNAFLVVTFLMLFFLVMCAIVAAKGKRENLSLAFSIILVVLAFVGGILTRMVYASC